MAAAVEGVLALVNAELAEVRAGIAAVEEKLLATEDKLDKAADDAPAAQVAALVAREQQLRTEKEQLNARAIVLGQSRLELLRASAPGATAAAHAAATAPEPEQLTTTAQVLDALRRVRLESPSRAAPHSILSGLAVFVWDEPPLTLRSAVPPEVTRRLMAECSRAGAGLNGLFMEAVFYPAATSSLPAWLHDVPRVPRALANAALLYGPPESVHVPGVALPWDCQPELFTPAAPGLPPFNGELKSVDGGPYNALATHILMGLAKAFFPATDPPTRRFYTHPPVGYGIVGYPHCGHLVGVEWVGKLLLNVLSHPFFLASPQHADAVAALQRFDYGEHVDIAVSDAAADAVWARHPAVGACLVSWCTRAQRGDFFYKIIEATAFDHLPGGRDARMLRALHVTYAAYTAAFDGAPPQRRPPALLRARLLYGAFAVMVEMPFVSGRHATLGELLEAGPVRESVLRAVCWLARRALLYVDLRPQNVLVAAGAAPAACWLVDYDDVAVLEAAPGTGEELCALLRARVTPAARKLVLPALEGPLAALYDEGEVSAG